MLKYIILVCLFLLPIQGNSQRINLEKSVKIKTYDPETLDTQLVIKGKSGDKNNNLSFLLGYGQLIGKGWNNPKSSWGQFGSGLISSEMSSVAGKIGPDYLGLLRDNSWGKNGLNFSIDSKMGGFSIGGAYSGYLDSYNLSFSSTVGSILGRGNFISRNGRLQEFRTDVEIKF